MMKIGFVIYNGMTALDFIGVYDAVTRLRTMGFLPDLQWEICSFTEKVADTNGLEILPTQINQPLENFDVVIVPGGLNWKELMSNEPFLRWLSTAASCKLKVSVCTGAMLLGTLGFLKGKKATTHPSIYNELRPFCSEVLEKRIVDEGDVITARGVTSSIDLGLYLCEKLAGKEAKQKIQRQMDWQG
jgi:cyclohexyl-isocyanide hydratase